MNIVPNDIINVARVFWWVTTFICMWCNCSSFSNQFKHAFATHGMLTRNKRNNPLKHWTLVHGTCTTPLGY